MVGSRVVSESQPSPLAKTTSPLWFITPKRNNRQQNNMADPKTPTKADQQAEALKLIDEAQETALKEQGKDGHNPFVFINNVLNRLRTEVANADNLPETMKKVKALKVETAVVVDKSSTASNINKAAKKASQAKKDEAAKKAKQPAATPTA